MTTSAITFDQMERRADRTFALALWAKHASAAGQLVMMTTLISWALKGLLRSLSPERLESLYGEHAIELTKRLQETHGILTHLSRTAEIHHVCERPVIGPLMRSVQESTEDLGDIIEDLILSENKDFRSLVATSSKTLSHSTQPRAIERV
jgi:hypothetical protein